eukprot:6034774-Amphidinium_carterae.2
MACRHVLRFCPNEVILHRAISACLEHGRDAGHFLYRQRQYGRCIVEPFVVELLPRGPQCPSR